MIEVFGSTLFLDECSWSYFLFSSQRQTSHPFCKAERKTFNKFTPKVQLIHIYATKKGQGGTISLKQQSGTEIYSKSPLFFLCIAYS